MTGQMKPKNRDTWKRSQRISKMESFGDDTLPKKSNPSRRRSQQRSSAVETEKVMIPTVQAHFFFSRAKKLYLQGTGKSSDLERVLRDLFRALAHATDVGVYILIAKTYRRLHDHTSMMAALSNALKIDPTNQIVKNLLFDGFFTRGQELMYQAASEAGNNDKALRLWKKAQNCHYSAMSLFHHDRRVWLNHAICCIHLKENMKALESVNHALRISKNLNPTELVDIMTLRAKLYWALGLVDIGNREIRHVGKVLPDHVEVLAYTARCYHSAENYYKFALQQLTAGNYEGALHYITVAIKITEDDVKLYILHAVLHRVMGNLNEAFNSITRAKKVFMDLKSNKNSHLDRQRDREQNAAKSNAAGLTLLSPAKSKQTPLSTASMLEEHNKIKNLMDVPDEIVRQTNLIFNELAMQSATKGDYEKAIVLFTKVINASKDLCQRFHKYNEMKQSRGLSTYQSTEIITNQSDQDYYKYIMDYRYYSNRGDCYRAMNKLDDAFNDYSRAHDLAPNEWTVKTKLSLIHYLKGVAAFNAHDLIQAESSLSQAVKLNPKIAEYYTTRGRIRYHIANYIGAAEDYRKAVELNPKAADISMKLEQFDAGGSHSMKQLQVTLPPHILQLIEEGKRRVQKRKKDIKREQVISLGLFFNEDDDKKTHKKVVKPKPVLSKSEPLPREKRVSRLPPIPSATILSNKQLDPSPSTTTLLQLAKHAADIDSNFIPVLAVRDEYNHKKRQAKHVIDKKLDTSKGSLWELLNSAKSLAHGRKERQKTADLNLPASLVALKKKSKLASLKASQSNHLTLGVSSDAQTGAVFSKSSSATKFKRSRRNSLQNTFQNGEDPIIEEDEDDEDEEKVETANEAENTSLTDIPVEEAPVIENVIEQVNDDINDEDVDDERPKTSHLIRQQRNRTNGDDEGDENDEDEDDFESAVDSILLKPNGESKLANFLKSSGVAQEWNPDETSSENHSESMLNASEEEEMRKAYQLAQINLENEMIAKRLQALKLERQIKEQGYGLKRKDSRRSSVDSY